MGDRSGIEWTDATWNPVTGCSKVSAGCKNCYAETVAERFWGHQYGDRKFVEVRTHADRLDQPLRWRRPRRVFVNSMSDLFHKDVPDEFIDRVFAVMALAPQHTFQVLTKRPERMRAYVSGRERHPALVNAARRLGRDIAGEWFEERADGRIARKQPVAWPLPNVWLGVSVEDQKAADERIPLLLETPAAVRFLSCEPLLGPLEFSDVTKRRDWASQIGRKALDGIDWVIAGGESGTWARPCDVGWIRSIVEQCRAAKVPVFVKQLGAVPVISFDPPKWLPGDAPGRLVRCERAALGNICDPKGANPAEWPFDDLRVQEFPCAR